MLGNNKAHISINIPLDLYEILKEKAREAGLSLSGYIVRRLAKLSGFTKREYEDEIGTWKPSGKYKKEPSAHV